MCFHFKKHYHKSIFDHQMAFHVYRRLVESFIIDDAYQFKSFRYPGLQIYISLTNTNKDELYKCLRALYPFGAPGKDTIQSYVQKMSCQFCLKFGHTCNPNIYPPTCPNIPNDYTKNLNFISNKYGIEIQMLNYLLMTGLGNFSQYGIEGSIPQWSWLHFEKQLNEIQCKYCFQLYHSTDKCPLYKKSIQSQNKHNDDENPKNEQLCAKL